MTIIIVMELASITDPTQAAALLAHPLRIAVMREARQAASATEIASRLGEPRQKVNYHVRELEKAKLLKPAGQRLKRNLMERRWIATAQAYVLAPQLMGDTLPDPARFKDRFSAEYLIASATRMQADVGTVLDHAAKENKRVATLGIVSDFAFETAEQRAEFTAALHAAVLDVIQKHTKPRSPGRKQRAFRLFVGCYPIPRENPA